MTVETIQREVVDTIERVEGIINGIVGFPLTEDRYYTPPGDTSGVSIYGMLDALKVSLCITLEEYAGDADRQADDRAIVAMYDSLSAVMVRSVDETPSGYHLLDTLKELPNDGYMGLLNTLYGSEQMKAYYRAKARIRALEAIDR